MVHSQSFVIIIQCIRSFFFFFFFSINICLQLICIKPHHRIHVCDFSQSDIDMGVRNKYTTNTWEA